VFPLIGANEFDLDERSPSSQCHAAPRFAGNLYGIRGVTNDVPTEAQVVGSEDVGNAIASITNVRLRSPTQFDLDGIDAQIHRTTPLSKRGCQSRFTNARGEAISAS
jgi:hypothetical protein